MTWKNYPIKWPISSPMNYSTLIQFTSFKYDRVLHVQGRNEVNHPFASLLLFFRQKTEQGWKEVLIDWNPSTKQLQYVLSPRRTLMTRLYENVCFISLTEVCEMKVLIKSFPLQFLNNIPDRQHVEISPQRGVMMQTLCKHISRHGGSALIGDYGHWGEKEDTFRVYLHSISVLINQSCPYTFS